MTNNTTTELLPCPFCGSKPKFNTGKNQFNDVEIECPTCYANIGVFDVDDGKPDETGRNKIAAITNWNRRAAAHGEPSNVSEVLSKLAKLHVGESAFENWFADYLQGSKGIKQIARDAYAAGMEDPLVAEVLAAAPAVSVEPSTAGNAEQVSEAKDWRMDAYYYSFEPTGNPAIDRILSAVACAGECYHNTDDWRGKTEPYAHLRGENPVEWIQNAANDAAAAIQSAPERKALSDDDIMVAVIAAGPTLFRAGMADYFGLTKQDLLTFSRAILAAQASAQSTDAYILSPATCNSLDAE